MHQTFRIFVSLSLACLITSLFGCGSSGGGSPTPQNQQGSNQLPVISSATSSVSTVHSGDVVTLTMVASDPDGDSLSSDWSQLTGTQGNFQNYSAMKTTWTAPFISQDVIFVLRALVGDGRGGSAYKDIQINGLH